MGQIFCFPVSVHLVLLNKDLVLLMRRKNTGFCDGMYSLMSGKLEPNESLDKAVIREAEEELGVFIDIEDLIPLSVMHRKGNDSERIDFFFCAKNGEEKRLLMNPLNVMTYGGVTLPNCH